MKDKITRVYAEIDLNAVRSNLFAMYKNLENDALIVAVIKTDAYGHGALPISRAIEDIPFIWGYAVATAEEAMELVEDGRKKPILILGISFHEQRECIVSHDIRPTVSSYEEAKAFSEIAVRKQCICRLHIAIDTGMSRIGLQVSKESAKVVEQISKLPNIMIEGIFTHFAKADEEDKTATYVQLSQFEQMIAWVEALGVQIPFQHCSNSAGIIELPKAHRNLVRAGITTYGLWPSDEVSKDVISLTPVMSLYSHISFVKELEAGRSISYGGTYVTTRPSRIATVPVGYGDGYSRGLSNKGYVLVNGKKAAICGRVCMDQFMIDVTDIEDVNVGDRVTLLGKDGEEQITMEELGNLSGRFNYEFACLITPRVPRVYLSE